MRILIIDDSRLLRTVNQRALERAGHEAIGAGDGEVGLDIAREKHPDLILLDMMLPKLSGPDVLRALKQDPVTSSIPVVVVSALSAKNQDKLVSEGAAAFIEKTDELVSGKSGALLQVVQRTMQESCALPGAASHQNQ